MCLTKLHVGNLLFLLDTCTDIILPPVGIPFGYLTFQKSSRKFFLTFHEYTCGDTVNTIGNIEICIKNKLSTYPEGVFFKVLRLLFLFSQILTNYNFSFVSKFFPIYSDPLEGPNWGACLCWEG